MKVADQHGGEYSSILFWSQFHQSFIMTTVPKKDRPFYDKKFHMRKMFHTLDLS